MLLPVEKKHRGVLRVALTHQLRAGSGLTRGRAAQYPSRDTGLFHPVSTLIGSGVFDGNPGRLAPVDVVVHRTFRHGGLVHIQSSAEQPWSGRSVNFPALSPVR